MVTLRDVAKEAGVTAATVSYVLRGTAQISPATTKRVMAAVKKLNYTRNLSASSLRMGRSGIIGVAVHDLAISHQNELARCISLEALKHGYQALIQQTLPTSNQPDIERNIIKSMVNQFCDGMIMSAGALPLEELQTLSQGKPIVMLDGHFPNSPFDTIFTPCEQGAETATTHLVELGCQRILIVGFAYREAHTEAERTRSGFRLVKGAATAIKRQNPSNFSPDRFIQCSWSAQGGSQAIQHVLEENVPFDGVYCLSDDIAFGAMNALTEAGYAIGGDLAAGQIPVVGFDATEAGRYYSPSLTSVSTSNGEQARIAVDTIINRIEHPGESFEPLRPTVDFQLVRRASTATR